MVTYGEAMLAFVVGLFLSIAVTYAALGQAVTVTMVPIWALSFIYPFAKRAIWTPQIILGLTMAACVFPPWIAIGNDWSSLGLPVRLFAAVFCWLVYLDLIYACQVGYHEAAHASFRLISIRISRIASTMKKQV